MLFSFPTRESFSEWKSVCQKAGRVFSGNLLPDVSSLRDYALSRGYLLKTNEIDYVLSYDSPLEFFKALRQSGAATKFPPAESGGTNQLLSVVRAWERDSTAAPRVTYRILFGSLARPGIQEICEEPVL
jgi:hypothetical protein